MATAKRKVIMSGEGNFSIGDETYYFKDGEEVTAKNAEHFDRLEAEALRRKALQDIDKPRDAKG